MEKGVADGSLMPPSVSFNAQREELKKRVLMGSGTLPVRQRLTNLASLATRFLATGPRAGLIVSLMCLGFTHVKPSDGRIRLPFKSLDH